MKREVYEELHRRLDAGDPVVLATVTRTSAESGVATLLGAELLAEPDGTVLGTLGEPELDRVVVRDAIAALERGVSATRHYGPRGEARRDDVEVFLESFIAPARLIIFGAVDFSRALVEVAKVLGFHVTVCDARPVFATRARFPLADEIVVDWPERYLERVGSSLGVRDAVCVLAR